MISRPAPSTRTIQIGAVLALLTLALYLPALRCDFVEYDDQQYVTDNPRVQAGWTWAGFKWAFGFHAGNWHPLAWLSHMTDCQFFGARAWGHHLTSVLLHTGTTVLLFLFLRRLTGFQWRSAAVAALFAWHPLHVESVAWVAERKDVLCAFFFVLTLMTYARFAELSQSGHPRAKIFYGVTLLVFSLALMAKPMAVTLPFVLLLLDFWPLRRVSWPQLDAQRTGWLLLEKIPLLAMSAIACWLTLQAQQLAIVSTAGLPVWQRLEHSIYAYNHYFWATFWPHNLAVYYPYEFHVPGWIVMGSIFVVAGILLLGLINLRQRPFILTGWLWYLGTLVPVIGLVQVGDQNWADRYTYLPSVGLYLLLVWAATEWLGGKRVLPVLAGAIAAAMLATTTVQLQYWKNTRTLFEHAAAVTRENALAVTVLGSQFAKEGKFDQAIGLYRTALSYTPNFPEAHFFLGNAYDEQGKLADAVAEYEKALWFKPTQEQTHIFLGIALGKMENYPAAIGHYQEALKLNPDSAATHNNLARIYHTLKQPEVAIHHYLAALEIDPKLSIAHNNLGILLVQQGQPAEGIRHLREALKLKPENSETRFNLARTLNEQGQWTEAATLLNNLVVSRKSDPQTHYQYARALAQLKRNREAMSAYATALLLSPNFSDALDGLAWILSTDTNTPNRNGTEAVKMARLACEQTKNHDPMKLKTLAAALAETGDFAEARSIIALAISSTNAPPALFQEMQASFAQSIAWREK